MRVLVSASLLLVLGACGDPSDNGAAAAAAGNATKYGVDGRETAGIGNYLPARAIYEAYRQGFQLCYNHDADGSCTQVERVVSITDDTIYSESIRLFDGGRTKVASPGTLQVKGMYLCQEITRDAATSSSAYTTDNTSAKIESSDIPLSEADHAQWHARILRAIGPQIGSEWCYRYSVLTRGADGKADILEEHKFIDGVEQPNSKPSRLKSFTANSSFQLRLPD